MSRDSDTFMNFISERIKHVAFLVDILLFESARRFCAPLDCCNCFVQRFLISFRYHRIRFLLPFSNSRSL